MPEFDPLKTKDRNTVAKAIERLPAATTEEIQTAFNATMNSWEQGKHPEYIQLKDLKDQLKSILTEAVRTIKGKTTGFTKFPNGQLAWTDNPVKPYIGYSWAYKPDVEKKLMKIDLYLERPCRDNPFLKTWVPFRYMKRTDGVLAFWYDNSI
jgi:hypothetical protein